MPRPKRTIQSELVIEGMPFIWRLHREQQWCTADGWKGISIQVSTAEGNSRELFLEYPPRKTYSDGWSHTDPRVRPRISAAKVESHIRQAIQAGWDPNSRGKPFAYQVTEIPG
jgi:hypothetical protein